MAQHTKFLNEARPTRFEIGKERKAAVLAPSCWSEQRATGWMLLPAGQRRQI